MNNSANSQQSGFRLIVALVLAVALVGASFGPRTATRALADETVPAADSTTSDSAPGDETIDEQPSSDTTDPAPPVATEPEPVDPEPVDPVQPEEPAVEPEPEPVDPVEEPEPAADDTSADTPADVQPASSEQTEETPAETPPPSPSLTYAPADHPNCKTADQQPETVAHGANLDYDCSFKVTLSGDHLAPSAVQLDWTVLAGVESGWAIQFLPPASQPEQPRAWTAESSDTPGFQFRSGIVDDTLADASDPFQTSQKLTFGVRVHRAVCETDPQPIALDVAVSASLPGLDGATVEELAPQTEPYKLAPILAPIPEPTLSFGGSLNFGDVAVDAFGVQQAPAPQSITVTVSGLDQACGDWNLQLKAKKLGGEDGSVISAKSLNLVSIDDNPTPDGGCALNRGCEIAVVTAGPDVAPAVTYTLGVSLVLPDQPHATTFNSKLTATLAEVES